MTDTQKSTIFDLIDRLTAVPFCCQELKDAAIAWKDSYGTDNEKYSASVLVDELNEDVMSADDTIRFFESPAAESYFGAEVAAQKLQELLDHKAAGGKYCNCEACSLGAELLEYKDILMA